MAHFTAPTLSHSDTALAAKPSVFGWIAGFVAAIRRDASDRRLRDQLADMDDAMLRDIGVADDELHKIRAREQFTPRAWAVRGAGQARYEF